MLYVAAARGNFEQGLREMDARAECILCPPLDQLTAHQRKVTQAVCYTCLHRVGGAEKLLAAKRLPLTTLSTPLFDASKMVHNVC